LIRAYAPKLIFMSIFGTIARAYSLFLIPLSLYFQASLISYLNSGYILLNRPPLPLCALHAS
jgi:hypothetical protein